MHFSQALHRALRDSMIDFPTSSMNMIFRVRAIPNFYILISGQRKHYLGTPEAVFRAYLKDISPIILQKYFLFSFFTQITNIPNAELTPDFITDYIMEHIPHARTVVESFEIIADDLLEA